MIQSLSIARARQQLNRLPELFAEHVETGAVAVTRRGEPVLALMPWETYEAIAETLEILGDERLAQALRRAVREVAEGGGVDWEKARRELEQ